tara:strand:+ start:26 stop:292 length:267 start_codon:yes stop_codon:yes gene_type:complete
MKATVKTNDVSTYKYYEVIATIDGEDEVLFGSYDRSDCLYEKEAESFWWKDQGYRQIRISHRLVSEAPDPEVYPESRIPNPESLSTNG